MGSKQYWENHSLDRDSLFNQSLIQCPGGSNLFFLRLVLVSRFVSVIYCDQAFSFWMVTNNVTSVEAISRGWVSVLILEIRRRSSSSSKEVGQDKYIRPVFLFDLSWQTSWNLLANHKTFLKTVFISRTWPSQVLTCLEILYPENKKKSWGQYKKPSLEPPERSICKDPTLVISTRKPIRFCSHRFFLQVLTLLHCLTCISIRSIYCPQGSLVCSALGA